MFKFSEYVFDVYDVKYREFRFDCSNVYLIFKNVRGYKRIVSDSSVEYIRCGRRYIFSFDSSSPAHIHYYTADKTSSLRFASWFDKFLGWVDLADYDECRSSGIISDDDIVIKSADEFPCQSEVDISDDQDDERVSDDSTVYGSADEIDPYFPFICPRCGYTVYVEYPLLSPEPDLLCGKCSCFSNGLIRLVPDLPF